MTPMELCIRAKGILDGSRTRREAIDKAFSLVGMLERIPPEAKIDTENNQDDYITFNVTAKDKDDVKYYKSIGFVKVEDYE